MEYCVCAVHRLSTLVEELIKQALYGLIQVVCVLFLTSLCSIKTTMTHQSLPLPVASSSLSSCPLIIHSPTHPHPHHVHVQTEGHTTCVWSTIARSKLKWAMDPRQPLPLSESFILFEFKMVDLCQMYT